MQKLFSIISEKNISLWIILDSLFNKQDIILECNQKLMSIRKQ